MYLNHFALATSFPLIGKSPSIGSKLLALKPDVQRGVITHSPDDRQTPESMHILQNVPIKIEGGKEFETCKGLEELMP